MVFSIEWKCIYFRGSYDLQIGDTLKTPLRKATIRFQNHTHIFERLSDLGTKNRILSNQIPRIPPKPRAERKIEYNSFVVLVDIPPKVPFGLCIFESSGFRKRIGEWSET